MTSERECSFKQTRWAHSAMLSYQAHLGYPADRYGLELEHLKVGEAFNPEVGFLRRDDFRRNYVYGRFSPRPRALKGIRKIGWEASLDRFADSEGRLESQAVVGTFLFETENGDLGNVRYTSSHEVLAAPFVIARDVVLPAGSYKFHEVRATYDLGPQRRVSGVLNVSRGSFYSGRRTQASYTGFVELTSQISLEPRVSLNWVDLAQGTFLATLVSARSTYTLTPRTFIAALVQYNSSASTLNGNVRFRWEYAPGSDLFVVLSEGRNTLEGPVQGLANRGLAVKFTRLFRF